jgi:hypothetical protein
MGAADAADDPDAAGPADGPAGEGGGTAPAALEGLSLNEAAQAQGQLPAGPLPMDKLLDEVERLLSLEEDEERPYDHHYRAAELLKAAIDAQAGEGSGGDRTSSSAAEAVGAAPPPPLAVLRALRGLALLDTDLLAEGEAEIRGALPDLEADTARRAPVLLESYNGLGALYSGRGDFDEALAWLAKAEALYRQHRAPDAAPPDGVPADGATPAGGEGAVPDATPGPASTSGRVASATGASQAAIEAHHTSTLFFLAQASALGFAFAAHSCMRASGGRMGGGRSAVGGGRPVSGAWARGRKAVGGRGNPACPPRGRRCTGTRATRPSPLSTAPRRCSGS